MNKIFEEALKEVNIEEVMKDTLKEHIDKSIKDTIKDMFSWSGTGRKAIEEKIKAEMNINLDSINFQDYMHLMEDEITRTINDHIINQVGELTEKVLLTHEHIKPIYQLREIVEKYVDDLDRDDDVDEITGDVSINFEYGTYDRVGGDWKTVIIEATGDKEFRVELYMYKNSIRRYKCDDIYDAASVNDLLEKIYKLGMSLIVEDDLDGEEWHYNNRDY